MSYGGFGVGSYYEWVVIATATYVLILLVFITVYVASETKRSFELWFLGCGCLLNLIGGIIELIYDIQYDGNWGAFLVATLMIIAAVAMGIDFVLQVKQ